MEAGKSDDRGLGRVVVDTCESLLVALILALIFRAFVVEAFIIPTGSMADTLRGAHFRLICPQCGYEYNYGFVPQIYPIPGTDRFYPDNFLPDKPWPIVPQRLKSWPIPVCPMCKTQARVRPEWVYNGDRILVLKYIYQFLDPKTWDVVVFRNPTEPQRSFIKRLIGRPGETVELIDGDVYLNGRIQTKPPEVQRELWIKMWDSDYLAVGQKIPGQSRQLFTPDNKSTAWKIDQDERKIFFAGSSYPGQLLAFNPGFLKYDLDNFLAYNGPSDYQQATASDVKVELTARAGSEPARLHITLPKYGRNYQATFLNTGMSYLLGETSEPLAQKLLAPWPAGKPVVVSFALVDHQLILTLNGQELKYTLDNDKAKLGYEPDKQYLQAIYISAQDGPLTLERQVIYRDVHYLNAETVSGRFGRAREVKPFKLGPDEFFVLGDNTARSHDSRFWSEAGIGIDRNPVYPEGVVPREYLVGRAFFVYWPAALHLRDFSPGFIPNLGEMRFIH